MTPLTLIGPFLHTADVTKLGPMFKTYEDQFAVGLKSRVSEEKNLVGVGLDKVTWYYYDRALILYREYIRTNNPLLLTRAHKAALLYRAAILPNIDPPMYWSFIQGLALHYLYTKDAKTGQVIAGLLKQCYDPYYLLRLSGKIPADGNPEGTDNRTMGRVLEHFVVAYAISAPVIANPWEDKRSYKVMAKYCLDEILKSQSLAGNFAAKTKQKSPFMIGILHEALILYYRLVEADPRIPVAIEKSANFMWRWWKPIPKAFTYDPGRFDQSPDDLLPAPDLNLLIAPSFGWLYKMTKNVLYKTRGDLIFQGGINRLYMDDNAKHFNQQHCFGPYYPALRNS